jgi:hypothetical protein
MGITVNVETCEKKYSSYYIDTPVKTPTPRACIFVPIEFILHKCSCKKHLHLVLLYLCLVSQK